MNILYCGDGNTADGVIISALSLCRASDEALNFYILTATVSHKSTLRNALPCEFVDFLRKKVQNYNSESTVTLTDITEIFSENPPVANMDTRFTPCCMLRLYADLVPTLPEKLLYLDNDVICRQNPAEFYNRDLSGHTLAGVLDYYGSWFFRTNPFIRDYLNSGVLLLNMKRIRETGFFEKCREKCKNEEMFMPDQSAINKLCEDKLICPRRYNEQRKLRRDTVFQHFTTGFRLFPWFHTVSVKPWDINGMHRVLHLHEYDGLLSEYTQARREYEKETTK